MIATLLNEAGLIITAGLCTVAVLLVGSLANRFRLSFVARKRLNELERTYRTAFSWPIGYEDDPFPSVARALTVASREAHRRKMSLWVEPALQQMAGDVRVQPSYIIELCASMDGLLRTIIDEQSSHEADILEFADRIRRDVLLSSSETLLRLIAVRALLDDPRFADFTLDGPRRRLRMLMNAFSADAQLMDGAPETVFRHLAVQAAVVTECALEATRRTAGWPFLMEAWEGILSRLTLAQRTLHVLTMWAGLLAPDDPRSDAKGHLARFQEINRQLAIVASACAAASTGADAPSRLEELFWKSEGAHKALRTVEVLLRNVITRLDAATTASAKMSVH